VEEASLETRSDLRDLPRFALSTAGAEIRLIKANVLQESFRCPDSLCSFELASGLSENPGYFLFGQDTICYGRCVGQPATNPTGTLRDLSKEVRIDGSTVILPFDPADVIANLRFERYSTSPAGPGAGLLSSAYYLARPAMPVWFRRHLQRSHLKGARGVKFPRWPVDSTVEWIQETLLSLAIKARGGEDVPFVWFWPQGFPSCAIVTHDVEAQAGLEFCPALMDINDSFGIKSSFQIIPEKRYSVTDALLNSIRDRDFEVNVHDLNHDGHLYSERAEFLRRAHKINQYGRGWGAKGFRSGALYRNLSWFNELDFDYDMSVPSAGHLEAQGGGCCTIRPYFINQMVELPVTTTQDYTLFHILGDYSIELWKQEIETIIKRHGLISFIIHPDYIREKKAQETYRSLLRHLSQLRAEGKIWIALPGEVANWWRLRDKMTAVHRDDIWHVAGPSADRAVLSHAFSDGVNLSYKTPTALQNTSGHES
jgi:hypothetical protein